MIHTCKTNNKKKWKHLNKTLILSQAIKHVEQIHKARVIANLLRLLLKNLDKQSNQNIVVKTNILKKDASILTKHLRLS